MGLNVISGQNEVMDKNDLQTEWGHLFFFLNMFSGTDYFWAVCQYALINWPIVFRGKSNSQSVSDHSTLSKTIDWDLQ